MGQAEMKIISKHAGIARLVFIGLILLAAGLTLPGAASGEEVARQIWVDVDPAYFLDPDFKFYGNIGARWEYGESGWWRLVAEPSFRTRLRGRFHFAFGLGNFVTFNEVIDDRWELRPFQRLDFNWPRGKFALNHAFRLEERYDYNLATWDVRTSLRGRYRVSVNYQFGGRLRSDRFWQGFAAVELYAKLTGEEGQMREQSRITVGAYRSLRRDIHFRFELTWQKDGAFYGPAFGLDEGSSVMYFRFRLAKSWGQSKSLREEASS